MLTHDRIEKGNNFTVNLQFYFFIYWISCLFRNYSVDYVTQEVDNPFRDFCLKKVYPYFMNFSD